MLAIINKIFFYQLIDKGWVDAQKSFRRQFDGFPDDAIQLQVNNINDEQTQSFCQQLDYDLIVVSGTSLIKKHMFKYQRSLGIINLHTGLSPYIKGGPNCTNWCLSTQNYHLIGNTVMWLDEGIDSGNIICTETARFDPDIGLRHLLGTVIEQGQDLYLRAIGLIAKSPDTIPSVAQGTIAKGQTFYNRQWGFVARLKLVINFYFGNFSRRTKKDILDQQKANVITIKLPDA